MPAKPMRRNIVAVTVAVVAALGVYLLAQGSPAHSDATQLTAASTSVANQFAAFGRPADAEDSLPNEPTISGTVVRHVGATDASTWASIDNARLCIQEETGANVCVPTESFSGKPLVMAPGSSQTPERLIGLVPDGISSVTAVLADGSRKTAAVTDNGFTLAVGQDVKEIQWTTPDNVTHTQEW